MLLTDAVLLQLVILVLVLLDVMAVAFEIVVIVNLVEFVDEELGERVEAGLHYTSVRWRWRWWL